jgi:hypothetical protein
LFDPDKIPRIEGRGLTLNASSLSSLSVPLHKLIMLDADQQQMERGGEKGAMPLFEEKGGAIVSVLEGEEVNASGHRDQLQRQYSIWSICGLALTIDNAWVALGGSIVVAVGTAPIPSPCR